MPKIFSLILLLFHTLSFAEGRNRTVSPEIPTKLFTSSNVEPLFGSISISWKTNENSATLTDWIGLFELHAPSDAEHLLWSHNTNGILEGTFDLRLPIIQNNYEFRYFSGGNYNIVMAKSPPVLSLECGLLGLTKSKIKHLVLIVQENHSFDSIYGSYCSADTGSNPTCNVGFNCCERGPKFDPGSYLPHVTLTDGMNAFFGPSHGRNAELSKMNGGKMNRYVILGKSSFLLNFAYANQKTASQYWEYAQKFAMTDQYFQSIAGASSGNDMYLARGAFVFDDDEYAPAGAVGVDSNSANKKQFYEPNIGDMLRACKIPFLTYAEGYDATKFSETNIPELPSDCKPKSKTDPYPCNYDPTDIPFEYYPNLVGKYIQDLDNNFGKAIDSGTLPSFSFIKNLAYKNEHPGSGVTITKGANAVNSVVEKILKSPIYKNNTLILLTYDEGGGYFDHISPPANSVIDGQPYGVRIPFLALGYFAKTNFISHTLMEHASVIKFIEWNWFPGRQGQLGTRDLVVNNIGSLLDPEKTGVQVP